MSIVSDSLNGHQVVSSSSAQMSGEVRLAVDPNRRTTAPPSANGHSQHADARPPDDDEPEDVATHAPPSVAHVPLIVHLNGQTHQVLPVQLQSEEYRRQFTDQLAHNGRPAFDLGHLLDWTDTERWSVLAFIAGLSFSYTLRAGGIETDNLFAAVLATMEGAADVRRCGRGVQAVIDAVAIAHRQPAEWPAACAGIVQRLKQLDVKSYTPGELKKMVRQRLADAQMPRRVEEPTLILLLDVFPEAPVPADVVIPANWLLSAEGIAKGTGDDAEVIIPSPMVITRRFADVDGDTEHLGVAWLRDGRWHEEIVPRGNVMDSRAILQLADHGAPVTSNNAKDVVQYLADFEAHNLEGLPRALAARQLGWQGDGGRYGFLWGQQLLREEQTAPCSMIDSERAAGDLQVVFRGADEGDDQLAGGYRQAGTFEGWANAARPIGNYPRVRFSIYAALTPPMLEILGAENFLVSHAGATSQGKTITLRGAASVWGCPDERSPTAAIGTWDATRVWFGRAPSVINHLPLVVDDTKRAADRRVVSQMIYDVASGRGRGRGSKEGLARSEAFRTVMLTTGEAPITSFSNEGGTRPRVLELWGSPFGGANEITAQLVNEINDGVLDNYGHLGPAFVAYLIENREHWQAWREHYRHLRARYAHRAGSNSVAARMAGHFAAIRITAILVHRAVAMPWGYHDVVTQLWPELTAEAPEADQAAAALRHVLSWAIGHRNHFDPAVGGNPPADGWAGRWELDGIRCNQADGYLGLLPHKLTPILEMAGFDAAAIVRLWDGRGWLKKSEDRRQYKMRMGTSQTRGYAITRQAIEEVQGPLESNDAVGPQRQLRAGA